MIDVMESNTRVTTPEGHIGLFIATRRERILLDKNPRLFVQVMHTHGLSKFFRYNELVETPLETPPQESTL